MIRLGFEETPVLQEDPEEISSEEAREIINRNVKHYINLKKEREEEILKEYDCVVVRSFGDDYHLSDKEKKKKNKFYKLFKDYQRFQKKIRQPVQYVKAMRACLKCLDAVARSNGVYDENKFKKLFIKGEIKINGLIFPKFVGRQAKKYDKSNLLEFILSNEPAEEIDEENKSSPFDGYSTEELRKLLFTKKEWKQIIKKPTKQEDYYNNKIFDSEVDDPYGHNVVIPQSKKVSNKSLRKIPELAQITKEIKRQQTTGKNLISSFRSNLLYTDFSDMAKYDSRYDYESPDDLPVFKGEIINTKDFKEYMDKVDEFELTKVKRTFNGHARSEEQIREAKSAEVLEEEGWNISQFVINKEREKKLEKVERINRKREKKLKLKLQRIQQKNTRRMNDKDSSSSITDKDIKEAKKNDKKKLKKKIEKKLGGNNKNKKVYELKL